MTTENDEKEMSSVVRALIWDGICSIGDSATPDSMADYVIRKFDPEGKLSPLMAHAAWNGARKLAVEEMAWQESEAGTAEARNGLSARAARLSLETAVLRARMEAQLATDQFSGDANSKM
ncbi:hypothetical protein sS8_1597 [Methylocaldum marinum]|uniref:Uncharacterized protein n=1 Tax=Methylocaldum marinum TaxID=1432792 RepID=A0A250KPG1_9GAMM|nr:hypothetical protein [Methylocaldum marinum]BBA33555.1 hypothetical protein sS8_1597 [Methylocaldum marinum]